MTQRSLLWTDATGDGGPYSQDTLRLLTKTLTGAPAADEGVFAGQLNELAVTSTGNNNVTVATGRALVDGTLYENDAANAITVASPTTGTTGVLIGLKKDWAAQTVRAFARKNTDGTAAIPAVVQTDGTTWEIPLASCTITTAGVIGALTDTRQYVPVGGAWKPVQTVSLATAAASVSFQGIPSQYTQFRLTVRNVSDTTSKTLLLRLNNDSGTNYYYEILTANGSTVSAANLSSQTSLPIASVAATYHHLSTLTISKPLAAQIAVIAVQTAIGNNVTQTIAGQWINTTDLINRIDVIASAGNFVAGSLFVLEGTGA